jgi:hypothetical protein
VFQVFTGKLSSDSPSEMDDVIDFRQAMIGGALVGGGLGGVVWCISGWAILDTFPESWGWGAFVVFALLGVLIGGIGGLFGVVAGGLGWLVPPAAMLVHKLVFFLGSRLVVWLRENPRTSE